MSASSATHSTAPIADSSAPTSARCACETRAFGTATVMPRPIAAGVLGMARTIAAPGKLRARNCKVRPAMMDTTTVAPPTNGASAGMTSSATCGLTATTTAATSPTASRDALRRRPRALNAAISRLGCGSITAIFAGASPSASQPSSMALPILPAPARRMVPDRSARVPRAVDVLMRLSVIPAAQTSLRSLRMLDCVARPESTTTALEMRHDGSHTASSVVMDCGLVATNSARPTWAMIIGDLEKARDRWRPGMTAAALRLPLSVEHGGVERLARRLARPDDELEGGEVPLAGIERGREQRLALPARRLDAAGQHQRVAVHDQPVLNPQVEMPDPHLLVDQRDELLHLAAAALRHFELEGAGEMQRLDVEHPGIGNLIVAPFAGHQDGDLVLARALERPAVGRGHPLHDLERVAMRLFGKVDEGHSGLHPGSGMRTRTPRRSLTRSPGGADRPLRGESLGESNITPSIPVAEAQSGGVAMIVWWISRRRSRFSTGSVSGQGLVPASRPLTGDSRQSNRLDTDSSAAVRPMASPIRLATESVRILRATLTAWVGWIESVMTSSLSREAVMRATAPPESTPWVI